MIFVPKYASPTFPPIHQQQQQGPGGSSYIIFLRPSTGPGAALAVALVHCITALNACAQKLCSSKSLGIPDICHERRERRACKKIG